MQRDLWKEPRKIFITCAKGIVPWLAGEVRALGFPVLLGPSRKSFIGYTLNLPPDQRLEGTAAAVSVGITRGADIVRVHDVETIVRVARMTDAIVRPPFGVNHV